MGLRTDGERSHSPQDWRMLMTVGLEAEAEIRRLYFAEHFRIGTISSQLHVHADVVRRVLGRLGARCKTLNHPSKLDEFRAFIEKTLERYPGLRATRLYDMLQARGYQGSIRLLRQHVSTVRPARKSEVFLRVQPLMGEQAQVDWAHVGSLQFPGGSRALWVFVIILAYSRAMWAELVLDLTAASLRRSLVRASVYFQGNPREWLFDNPKIVVLERHGDAVRFHPSLLELAGMCCVQPRLCGIRKPQHKGGVERAVRYLRDRYFAARTITSLETGNRDLLQFIDTIAHARRHPRFPEYTVRQVFEEERPRLLKLPDPLPPTDWILALPVDKTALIRFDSNAYSCPPQYANRTVSVAVNDTTLRIFDGTQCVAEHRRSWGRKQLIELPEHREALLAIKHAARQNKRTDRLRTQLPRIDVLLERWVEAGRNVGSMVARTLKLLDLYGQELMTAAIDEIIARGSHDPGALAVVCEQKRKSANRPIPLDVDFGPHVPEKDVIPHNLETYDEP
jgi:transposase